MHKRPSLEQWLIALRALVSIAAQSSAIINVIVGLVYAQMHYFHEPTNTIGWLQMSLVSTLITTELILCVARMLKRIVPRQENATTRLHVLTVTVTWCGFVLRDVYEPDWHQS